MVQIFLNVVVLTSRNLFVSFYSNKLSQTIVTLKADKLS